MTTLHITRGLPASGKSTHARRWVAEDPTSRARVNRDTFRLMLHDGQFVKGHTEKQVIAARDASIASLLASGTDVICDDTNLPNRVVRDLMRIAADAGADVNVIDLTDVDVAECVRRDALRDDTVGEDVIRDHHRRFVKGNGSPLPVPQPPDRAALNTYVTDPSLPSTILVDLDGTVALMDGRSPYDESRVSEDLPNVQVIAVVTAMAQAGHAVVFMSARTDGCYDATARWLDQHVPVDRAALIMRKAGDQRKDALVKAELFDRHIRGTYNVVGVFDDRRQVVDMWRSAGLTVFHVDDGDF